MPPGVSAMVKGGMIFQAIGVRFPYQTYQTPIMVEPLAMLGRLPKSNCAF